jgi:predicted nucleic acid-binding protein
MEQKKYLIDSNVVIDYLSQKLPSNSMDFMNGIIDATPNVSVITKIEVLGFNSDNESYLLLNEFINDSNVLEISNQVVEKCIDIRKNYKTKLPDAIIAATAIVNEMFIISRNVADFKNIIGLQVIDPYLI